MNAEKEDLADSDVNIEMVLEVSLKDKMRKNKIRKCRVVGIGVDT